MKAQLIPKHQIIPIERRDDYERIKVSIQVPMILGWIERVRFIVFTNTLKHSEPVLYVSKDEEYATFQTELNLPTNAIYFYYFSFESNGQYNIVNKYGCTNNRFIAQEDCFKLSIGFTVPEWAKEAVMYHIFVDRFARDDTVPMPEMPNRIIKGWNSKPEIGPVNGQWNIDFYGGNLNGIRKKLNYLQSLGVTILYLSPIVRSQSNHRYDTADYEVVDPYVGSNEDLRLLCLEAHDRGMKVILDAVFNHTGNDSKYFNQFGTYPTLGAYQSRDSEYFNFYKRFWSSEGSHFSFWWGMQNLPECNSASPEWKEYILGKGGIIDKWFAFGIDGLRLDVADELSDEFIEMIRTAVHRNKKDGFILGEVWKNPMRMNRGYLSSGKAMDSVMNYPLVDALIRYYKYQNVWKLKSTIKEILVEYPEDTIHSLMNFTSTHDISRIIEIFACNAFQRNGEWAWNLINDNREWIEHHTMTDEEYQYGKKLLKSFMIVLAMLPGIFSIFYGDEVGLKGIGNLANRAPFPWNNGDCELQDFVRKLGRLKANSQFLKETDCQILKIDEKQIMFERIHKTGKGILVIASRSHFETLINLPEDLEITNILLSTNKNISFERLNPYEAIVLEVKK